MKVLVVDDEPTIVETVSYNLRLENFQTMSATNAEDCLDLARSERPDLILLDVMLPSASGFDVCRRLRQFSDVPVIMLTARTDETDRVVGLEIGADDYVTKPFSMRELMARVKSVLRRRTSALASAVPETQIRLGNLVVDAFRHEVTFDGNTLELSRKEFELLLHFVRNVNRTMSRDALLDEVWGKDMCVGERTVDVHVRWLREKIEVDPSIPKRLLTVRGVGYQFRHE
ncbi:MAG: response regulator transcription factor [Capsulimonadaceae bacterium]